MITTARFKNFRLLKDVSIDLGRLNVLVGRNGVGKSTVLEGLYRLLLCMVDPTRPEAVAQIRQVFEEGTNASSMASKPDCKTFEIEAKGEDDTSFALSYNPAWPPETSFAVTYSGTRNPLAWDEAVYLKLNAEAVSSEHYSEADVPTIERDGSGIASFLQYLQGLRDGSIEAIESSLAKVVPGVRRIRALPARVERNEKVRVSVNGRESLLDQRRVLTGARFEVEFQGQGWIEADQLSEGTLLVLALLTVLRHDPPNLLLLDDLDKGLHPVAQRELIALIRSLQETKPYVQLVATSHSPFVLDELDASEAFIVGAVDATSSKIVRLDRHPAWEKRKGYLHPGEFWSAVGEGWVAESST